MRATYLLLAGLLALGVVGCGDDSSFAVAPVAGTVTLNGKPLADARITFHPTTSGTDVGPDAAGLTDAQGHFSLTTVDGRQGATVGTSLVRISTLKMAENQDKSLANANQFIRMQQPGSVLTPEKIPLKYNKDTPLNFTVPKEGTNSANFDLTGDPPPTPVNGSPRRGIMPKNPMFQTYIDDCSTAS